jgi:hypothetical protein
MSYLKQSQEPNTTVLAPRPRQRTSLKELDADKELLDQYNRAMQLFTDAEFDESASVAGKVAALNAISTVISNITKTKTELYNSERVKVMENVLISTLKKHPTLAETFLEKYKEALGEAFPND